MFSWAVLANFDLEERGRLSCSHLGASEMSQRFKFRSPKGGFNRLGSMISLDTQTLKCALVPLWKKSSSKSWQTLGAQLRKNSSAERPKSAWSSLISLPLVKTPSSTFAALLVQESLLSSALLQIDSRGNSASSLTMAWTSLLSATSVVHYSLT